MNRLTNASTILADLTAAGLALRAEGERLIVTPGHRITRPVRDLIRRHKPELLALVRDTPGPMTPYDREAIVETTAERAAIMEHDGGLPRPQAEALAKSAMRVFRYRLTDKPDTWMVLICPGCNLAEARAVLGGQFSESRVLDVLEASHD
jgi:hypothetical protein